ncbi:hypothetical protein LEP1GSC058_0723 [Leptospira fainei serovar Hurstbridge str. BUT 6]|uniref:Uncharacterized protein n=1 Tax=Leptospira fainei serovar Hurstbridge str. BUT 6 TaxID=1193011 RepID=S3V0G9_9LEPT|nr:hypothetical protein LEP1GSC058_0003 [Leptospira fainei serovar Hurstbridge str. BUT 6]EPG76176.1 hypothetical protein LEP1GSC058_0723 [Leptospira fainei serovar Hurstbridge str. BUT 6]
MRISVYLNDLLRQSLLLFAIRFKEEEEFSDKPGLFFNRPPAQDGWGFSISNHLKSKSWKRKNYFWNSGSKRVLAEIQFFKRNRT